MLLHNIVGLAPSELLQNPVLIVLRLIREVLVFVLNQATVTEFLLWKQRLDFCALVQIDLSSKLFINCCKVINGKLIESEINYGPESKIFSALGL